MNYLYHMVPENIKGRILMPLNQLKIKHPKTYSEAIKKYEGRERVMKQKIPKLNCLWNDVLHLSPVDPSKMIDALEKIARRKLKKSKWFRIDPKLLDIKKTIVYLHPNKPFKERNKPKYFVSFNIKNLEKYDKVPKATISYFKEEFSMKRKPLLFHLVPHILYKGKINVKDLEVIGA